MKNLKNICLSCVMLVLSACGDDLSGLPDPDQKAPGVEPDSFTFASATYIDVDDGAEIYSQVPANQTRYYQFSIPYYNAGGDSRGDLLSLTLVAADGDLELAFYDANQVSKFVHHNELDFTIIDSSFPTHNTGGYSDEYKIYFSVKNDTELNVNYQLSIIEKQ